MSSQITSTIFVAHFLELSLTPSFPPEKRHQSDASQVASFAILQREICTAFLPMWPQSYDQHTLFKHSQSFLAQYAK